MLEDRLERDPFLSEVFSRDCFVVRNFGDQFAPPNEAGAFVYAKVPIDDPFLVGRLCRSGFEMVDTAATFERPSNHGRQYEVRPSVTVRPANEGDKEEVGRVAGSSFQFSRFHQDSRFTLGEANELKRRWSENFFSELRGDHLYVAENESGEILGFNLLIEKENVVVIDLLAVASAAQNRGVGSALIEGALTKFGAKRVIVGTQLINTPSIRTYMRAGFKFTGANHILHWHGPLRQRS